MMKISYHQTKNLITTRNEKVRIGTESEYRKANYNYNYDTDNKNEDGADNDNGSGEDCNCNCDCKENCSKCNCKMKHLIACCSITACILFFVILLIGFITFVVLNNIYELHPIIMVFTFLQVY